MSDLLIQSLEKAIRQDGGEIRDFIAKFVKIPSENPPGRHYSDCRDFLCERLSKYGLAPTVLALRSPSGEETFAVQALVGSEGPTVYFHGHYDVVPGFSDSQFAPEITNGNMFGRGTADMKGGIALMLFAAKAIKDAGVPIRGRVGLTFVPDEETGGERGSQILAKQGVLGKDGIAMFTAEPTSGIVWNSSRGAISLKIIFQGKSSHVGQHYKGANAFEAMLEVSNRLIQHKAKLQERKTNFPISPEPARSSVMLIGGTVSGGSNFNSVPDNCAFTVDRRFNPEESLDAVEKELLDIIEQEGPPGTSMRVETLQRAPSSASEEGSLPARTLAKHAASVLKKAPEFQLCPGLLETRFYAQKHIPAFAYGPGLLSVAHGPNEFVSLRSTEDFALIYALTACDLLGAKLS
jgi:succinyl-diaminopimelate desuccinylase